MYTSKLTGITVLVLSVFLLGLGPLITIASMNALLGLTIGITLWNWFAVAVISALSIFGLTLMFLVFGLVGLVAAVSKLAIK